MGNNYSQVRALIVKINDMVEESREDLVASIMIMVGYALNEGDVKAINKFKDDGRLSIFLDPNIDISNMDNEDLMIFFNKHKEYVVDTSNQMYKLGAIKMNKDEYNQYIINVNNRYIQYRSMQVTLNNLIYN